MTGHQMFQGKASTMIEILAHPRRRHVILCLREYENSMVLADLADEIAALENETSPMEVPPDEVERVYLSLYHTHVPKLADTGVVQYEQEKNAVTLADRAEQLDQYSESPIGEL